MCLSWKKKAMEPNIHWVHLVGMLLYIIALIFSFGCLSVIYSLFFCYYFLLCWVSVCLHIWLSLYTFLSFIPFFIGFSEGILLSRKSFQFILLLILNHFIFLLIVLYFILFITYVLLSSSEISEVLIPVAFLPPFWSWALCSFRCLKILVCFPIWR